MALGTITELARSKLSNLQIVLANVNFGNPYVVGGEVLTPALFSFSEIRGLFIENPNDQGYAINYQAANTSLMVFNPVAAHTHGPGTLADAASAAGASHNHVFTGTSPLGDLNLATPAFSGTGFATAGQVITTTDNQTMTLNQCAGMWFLPDVNTKPVVLILSNTAVTGAQAVLTVQGTAPTTDAGAYKIIKALTPIGTNAAEATHTHAVALDGGASAASTATVGTEVGAIDLSALTNVRVLVIGV